MALQKSFENQMGHTGDYWRVDNIYMERKGMQMECRFNLYKSKVDRDGGKRQMDTVKSITLTIPIATTTLAQLVRGIYTDVKTTITNDQEQGDTPFFDGAADI